MDFGRPPLHFDIKRTFVSRKIFEDQVSPESAWSAERATGIEPA
jgi:hypothetical protein